MSESAQPLTAEAHFEVYEDEAGEWRWRLVGGNGEGVVPPEGHRDSTDAIRAIRTAQRIFDQSPMIIVRERS